MRTTFRVVTYKLMHQVEDLCFVHVNVILVLVFANPRHMHNGIQDYPIISVTIRGRKQNNLCIVMIYAQV